MKIEIIITDERIRDLMAYGNSRYWSDGFKWRGKKLGFQLRETGDKAPKIHNVTTEMVRIGLTKMARAASDEGGWHFECVRDDGKSDMWTGDAVVQFAVFGKLKYG